jgi:hypothetical protein
MSCVIGIDPDSEKHGVACYLDGKLVRLEMMNTIEIIDSFVNTILIQGEPLFSIENVMANQFVYARNRQKKKAVESQIAMRTGRCQQAQLELMRWLDHYKKPYVVHKPQSGNWADKRELFQKITGWKCNSNPDTRSAAYFGFLALNQSLKGQK